jgi:hypothetical protein
LSCRVAYAASVVDVGYVWISSKPECQCAAREKHPFALRSHSENVKELKSASVAHCSALIPVGSFSNITKILFEENACKFWMLRYAIMHNHYFVFMDYRV